MCVLDCPIRMPFAGFRIRHRSAIDFGCIRWPCSAKSFRSDRGSRFAVETAIKVIQEFFLSSQSSDINFSALKDAPKDFYHRDLSMSGEKLSTKIWVCQKMMKKN